MAIATYLYRAVLGGRGYRPYLAGLEEVLLCE